MRRKVRVAMMIALFCCGSVSADPMFDVSVSMTDEDGGETPTRELVVAIEVDADQAKRFGWDRGEPDPDDIGRGHPILQIDLPPSVELIGSAPDELKTAADYLTYFLEMPYGRRLLAAETVIPFRLTRPPEPGESLGLNVVAYLGEGTREDSHFVRQRLEIPLRDGGVARWVPSGTSKWGVSDSLAVGETATEFVLPGLDGEPVSLSSLKGGTVLVTTYRAHW